MNSETLICEPDLEALRDEAIRENGLIWVRYIGSVGPQANTVKGIVWQGDCVQVPPDEVLGLIESGEWQILKHGRCKDRLPISGERCIQGARPGDSRCAWHIMMASGQEGV